MHGSTPKPFPGSEAEKIANHATHHFVPVDEGTAIRCFNCEASLWGVTADYACGAAIPRDHHDLPAWLTAAFEAAKEAVEPSAEVRAEIRENLYR